MQHRVCLIFLLLFCSSCQLFYSTEKLTNTLIEQELEAINWEEVDQYPLFVDDCDELASKPEQLVCFRQQMHQKISQALKETKFTVAQNLQDTLLVNLKVDEDGFIRITSIQDNNNLEQAIPKLKQEITTKLNDFTTVAPALKQGNPVSTLFTLPIVIKTTN